MCVWSLPAASWSRPIRCRCDCAGPYVAVTCGKPRAVGIILSAGLDVLFLDPDVSLIRSPLPLVPQDSLVYYAYQVWPHTVTGE